MSAWEPCLGASDDATLAMIAARCAGETAAQIGRRFGVSEKTVSQRTVAVRAADAATHDPVSSPAEVMGEYW